MAALLWLAVGLAGWANGTWAATPPGPSVAFYYADDLPVSLLAQFDWAVVEADHVSASQLGRLQRYGTSAFAYVSVGEADQWRGDAAHVPAEALKARNDHWNSQAADLTHPAWTDYLLEQRIAPLWAQGYRGFFLDTLDSYRLFATTDADVAAQQQALVAFIKRLHQRFPGIRLLLNRGFEILDRVHDDIAGVAAESLYKAYDAGTQGYRDVSAADSDWLMNQLQRVRSQYGLPAIAIDYVAPADRATARATARRIAEAGLIPWVATGALDQVGVGLIEPMPRKVLVLYNGATADYGDFAFTDVHMFAAMPLEYMGYGAVYRDVNQPLPTGTLTGRYAGIVTWFDSEIAGTGDYRQWLIQQMADGMRVALFGDPGLSISGRLSELTGLSNVTNLVAPMTVAEHDALIGYEGMPPRPPANEAGFRWADDTHGNVAHLSMHDAGGQTFVPTVTGDWGGIALSPWVLQQGLPQQARWVLDPFTFLQRALDLPTMPVADATTENGSRYWMTEVDGDAFVSQGNFPGAPFTAQVLLDRVFKRYRVPTTVSVIEGEVGPAGLYPQLVDRVAPIAREIFSLPWVEIATHTFSHPFEWLSLKPGELAGEGRTPAGYGYNLPIKDYHYSLEREIAGSTAFINDTLAPPGKRVQAVLWSGDSVPPPEAIAIADRLGLANINGGNTAVTNDNPSLTNVSPMLRPFGEHVQVYSPQINENVYTNDMTGPFWGFRRVIETYKLTDTPKRLKPIDIYYHFYSAGQPAALNALTEVYDYVAGLETLPIHASTYSRIARDWYELGIARTLDGAWQITGATQARTLRLPPSLGWPNIAASTGVAGVRDLPQGRYVALTGAPKLTLRLQNGRPQSGAYIRRSNGRIVDWQAEGGSRTLRVQSDTVPLTLELGGTTGCRIHAPGARRASRGDTLELSYSGTDSGLVRADCG
ncbi:bifunctional glycoside hydrolase 114/ polysaccharide deacetylase family protein [Salinisphaera sp. T31B1]|uniref:bifunctional glycoside hydrolase 114/ polysaccharide deacetylase family protein n=1 Tax=Salinisphaera sp. T31B1 TaxID=727963 RepID=UPI003340674C